MRIRPLIICSVFLCWFLSPVAESGPSQEDEVFTSNAHGFRIKRPHVDWEFLHEEDPAAGTLSLVIRPKGTVGQLQASLQVQPSTMGMSGETLRDNALASIKDKPDYREQKPVTYPVAGQKVPGLWVEMQSSGSYYRLCQCYLVSQGNLYVLEYHASIDSFDQYKDLLEQTWASFELLDIVISEAQKRERLIATLAARCGSEVDWAPTWAEAAEKARKEKKLVLVRFKAQAGFKISDDANPGPFMDPALVGILQERCVGLRFSQGMPAPFVAQDSYGMGPFAFGDSILLVTPEGNVIGDTFTYETTSLQRFLLTILDRYPEWTKADPPENLGKLDLAEWHLKRGEYKTAENLLRNPTDRRGYRMKADLLTRQQRGEEALEALAATGEQTPELLVEAALIRMRMGRFAEAAVALKQVLKNHGEGDHLPRALYWLGACRLRLSGAKEAGLVWNKLIDDHAASRWAWKAAGSMQSTSFIAGLGERLDWPPEEMLATLDFPKLEPLTCAKARQAEKDAIAYLLAHQSENGSWISPSEVLTFKPSVPDEFTRAFTAICAQGLLPYRKDPKIKKAVLRAFDYLQEAHAKVKAAAEQPYFMDYSVYTNPYHLWFFCDLLRAGLVEETEVKATLAELIEDIQAKQKAGGGWSYYLTTDLSKAGEASNQSISFVTALTMTALIEAEEAGLNIPDDLMTSGLDCLERMSNPDGTFEYFLFHDNEDQPRNTPVAGAAGRAPLCALTLYRGKRRDLKAVKKGLDLFLEYRRTYAKEMGKTIMHCGADGQGSHYLMFDYYFAADALRRLPAAQRGPYLEPLLGQILEARSEEGSFVDNPLLGWHYGTGMALSAFHLLLNAR